MDKYVELCIQEYNILLEKAKLTCNSNIAFNSAKYNAYLKMCNDIFRYSKDADELKKLYTEFTEVINNGV